MMGYQDAQAASARVKDLLFHEPMCFFRSLN
jgi:hypothetical protein